MCLGLVLESNLDQLEGYDDDGFGSTSRQPVRTERDWVICLLTGEGAVCFTPENVGGELDRSFGRFQHQGGTSPPYSLPALR